VPSVGQELLDTPFPDMVAKLAMGIAQAQHALDENSVNTAVILADTEIEVVLAVTQTIDEDGTVSFSQAPKTAISLIQMGLLPTFYQFSEASIEVSMDIKTTTSTETNVKVAAEAKVGFAAWSASIKAEVSHNRKFGKEVTGTSRLFTKMTPVPPPPRIAPVINVVDNREEAGAAAGGGG
jgi:hypothetical protein